MIYSEETVALCALNKIFGYHPLLGRQLMEAAGSASALFKNPAPECPEHPDLVSQLGPGMLRWAREELEEVRRRGFRFLGQGDEDYPEQLMESDAPPLGLYVNGTSPPCEIFGPRPMVAIVGTRDMSPYGKDWCIRLVRALASAPVQPCIVSGLALGIDGVAHQTALDSGLPTIGVMATGIEAVYPWQHERLAVQMVRTPGCGLVTDYPLKTSPVALNFLRRNRIIAGFVRGIIVVESKTRGGSLMTAKYGVEYNRDVFALPGRADDIRSAGCNSLIHEHLADIITTPEDLVFRLGLGGKARRGAGGSWVTGEEGYRNALARKYGPAGGAGAPGADAILLGKVIYANRGLGPEKLSALTGLPYRRILELIGILEADGFVSTDLLRRCTAICPR